MQIGNVLRKTEKLIADNSPTIMTTIGVIGTVSTAYLTGKATFKAADILRNEHEAVEHSGGILTFQDDVRIVWKLYIPAATVGSITIASIIGANRVGTRRAAAMAAAYSISEKAFDEYKAKVIEKIGENKEQAVRDSIAEDHIRQPSEQRDTIVLGTGKSLCYDAFSGRYFESSVEEIKKAVNDINYIVNNHMYASLTDYYDKIGLPPIPISDDLGWSTNELMDINITAIVAEDGRPCIHISFSVEPIRNYFRTH